MTVDSRIAYVTVEHVYYGCESGCCGWQAFAYDLTGSLLHTSDFDFYHGGDNGLTADQQKDAARAFVAKHFPGATWNEAESDLSCPE